MNLEAGSNEEEVRPQFSKWKFALAFIVPTVAIIVFVILIIDTLTSSNANEFANLHNLIQTGSVSISD